MAKSFQIPGYWAYNLSEFILNDKAAIYGAASHMESTPQFKDCRIVSTPGIYGLRPTGIGYQKNSAYAEIFDFNIERMRASGVLDRINAKYSSYPQACPDLR